MLIFEFVWVFINKRNNSNFQISLCFYDSCNTLYHINQQINVSLIRKSYIFSSIRCSIAISILADGF
uniref:7TM_GPCR_Srx domain-containing protein n=1 Tax=Heterorhabditis bacteriophora TaxID=37862 RepID=A0A1I7WAW9_HETBA